MESCDDLVFPVHLSAVGFPSNASEKPRGSDALGSSFRHEEEACLSRSLRQTRPNSIYVLTHNGILSRAKNPHMQLSKKRFGILAGFALMLTLGMLLCLIVPAHGAGESCNASLFPQSVADAVLA